MKTHLPFLFVLGLATAGTAGLAPTRLGATTLEDTRITAPRANDEGTVACGTFPTYQWAPPHDPHRVAGTVMGAAAGAAIGAQIGGGKGQILGAMGGATAGAFIGRSIQGHFQHGRITGAAEHRCVFIAPGNNGTWSEETASRPIAP